MARNSMFDNPRFAGESNQPGERASVPNIQPVVDEEGAVELNNVGETLDMALDLKDMYTLESLRGEFEDSLQDVATQDSGLRDTFVSGLASGNAATIKALSGQLTRLSLAEKQGITGKTAVRTQQADVVRRAISDSPWLATEIRSMASSYNVAGFSASGQGDSPNDPFLEAENAVLEEAYRLELAGVPVEDRAELIKMAALSETQWKQLQTRNKGKFMTLALDQVEMQGAVLESHLNEQIKIMQATGSFNGEAILEQVNKWAGETRNRIKFGHARAQGKGATFEVSEAEIDNMVSAEVNFWTNAVKADNPLTLVEQRNKLRTANSLEYFSSGNSVFSHAMAVTGGDIKLSLDVAKQYGNMYEVLGGVSEEALNRLPPEQRWILQNLSSPDPQKVGEGMEMAQEQWSKGSTGGPGGAQYAQSMVHAALGSTEGGKPGSPARAALDMLMGVEGNLAYESFASFVPPEGQDGLPAFIINPLEDKMARDEIRNVGTLNAAGGPMFEPEVWAVPGVQTDSVRKYSLTYDEQSDWFVVVDRNGEKVNIGVLPSTNEVIRSVNQMNHIYNVRKRWGMWDGGQTYQTREQYVNWATGKSPSQDMDDAGLRPDDLAADHEFARRQQRSIQQQEGAGVTSLNPKEFEKVSNPMVRNTILKNEGGYQNDEDDSGNWTGGRVGAGDNVGTNMGITPITLANARGVDVSEITAEDMRSLSGEEAEDIYETAYLTGPKIDKLPTENLQHLVFDMGVVMGPQTSIKQLQKALGATPDGKIGSETLFRANNVDIGKIREAYSDYFHAVVGRYPEKKKFLRGWLNRLDRMVAGGGTSV